MAIGPRGPRFRTIAGLAAFGQKAKATLTTALAGANNDIKYTAVARGTSGNSITVAYVVAGNNTPLTVAVVSNAITVNVATDAGGLATSTADQVKAAIEASAAASALVTVEDATGNDGSGVVAALAATALSGGTEWTIGYGSNSVRVTSAR